MKVDVKKSKGKDTKKSSTRITMNGADLLRLARRMVVDRVGPVAAYGGELRDAFDGLVKERKLTRAEAEAHLKAAVGAAERGLNRLGDTVRGTWGRGLHLAGLATVQDVASLETRLRHIETRLDQLQKPARRSTRRSPRPRAVKKVETAAA